MHACAHQSQPWSGQHGMPSAAAYGPRNKADYTVSTALPTGVFASTLDYRFLP